MEWYPEKQAQKRENLRVRQKMTNALHRWFEGRDFDAVETPILQTCPVIDTHIRGFATDRLGVDGKLAQTMYLQTSPEFDMKKLLAGGYERIYQMCKVFRNAEGSKRHSPEFTIVEWYRANTNYNDIMDDCAALLRQCARAAGIDVFQYRDRTCDPYAGFERLTVCEAFERHADIDLAPLLEDREGLAAAVRALGLHCAEDDGWDDLFFRVMDAKIEPFLGDGKPCFLCDYPISMAALAKPKDSDPRFAERFELYVCGVELANAFSELTDADEQVRRYHIEMDEKERLYGERYPLDESFIKALRFGMPNSSGVALGFDRLVMLACGTDDINNVLWLPVGA